MLAAIGILGLCAVNVVFGCSPPMGWEHKEPLERLKEADLVIIGKIVSIDNTTHADEHLLSIEVDCILRNENNVSINSEIVVTEDSSGAMCINNMVSVKYNVPLTMSLRYENYDDENESEFWFANINVQGAIYDKKVIDPKELVTHCEFVSTKERMHPEDDDRGQCPAIPADSGCISGVVSTFVAPSVLVLICFLYAMMNM